MATKRDFEAVAQVIRNEKTAIEIVRSGKHDKGDDFFSGYLCGLSMIADKMADLYSADNPRFDRARFLTACGL